MHISEIKHRITNLSSKFILYLIALIQRIRIKDILLFIAIQVAIAAAVFVFFGLLPVIHEVKRVSASIDTSAVEKYYSLSDEEKTTYNQLLNAKRDEEYLISEIQMAKADSIYLIVNLKDSIAKLMVKGVPLLETRILKFKLSKGLEKLPEYYYNQLFNKPLQSLNDFSTIEKFPIVVKVAPKDTLEAQQSQTAPSAPSIIDVFYCLEFDQNISLEIRQSEADFVGPRKPLRQYKAIKRKKEIRNSISLLSLNNENRFSYNIEIDLPREDARAIYRALPVKPYILIRYR